LWVAFSARHSARRSGKEKFISTGHSVPGVIWNRMRTPSTISSWPVWVISSVGAMSPIEPVELVMPSPVPICASAALGSRLPNMNTERRAIARPAYTFSATAESMNPCPAMIGTSDEYTPCTPPK
jgi:hypothetical protein